MAKSFEEIKNRANEKKKEKKTFEDIKASVKNSKKVYDTGTSIQDYKQWASGIESLSERLNSYLDTSTYKAVDDSLTKDVSSYLSQADSMLEFVRGNRSRFEDYSKALSQIYSTKNALSDAMHEINKASSYYSNLDNEEEFLKDRKEANYKFEEQDKLRNYDLEDGKKAIAEAKKNLEWAINERDNYVYEPLPDNSQWLKSYTTPEAKARAKEEIRLEEIHDRQLWVDMYEEQLREAEDYYEKAEKAQNAYKLASVSNPESEYYDPEFERYAQMGEAIENPSYDDVKGGMGEIQNPVKYVRDNFNRLSVSGGSVMNGGRAIEVHGMNILYYGEMTEDEYKTYNYHLAQDSINSRKGNPSNNADKYLESLDLEDRWENGQLSFHAKYAEEHPVSASALSVVTSLGSGAEYLQDIFKYASTGEMDRNIMADITNTTRGTVSKKVDWKIGNWDAFDFLYNTGMSGVDSLTSGVIFGPAGGAVLGLSAAAQGTNDALDRGLSGSKVFWNGLTAGVFEGLFETVSIGQFDALKDSFVKNGKDIIKNLAKTMVVNASEETLTEIANLTYDRIVNGDFSQYEIAVRRYMEEEGMTEAEAKNKVAREQALQVVEAGASGALMGFGFGSIGSVANNRSSRKAGKNIIEAGEVDRLVELGKGFSPGSEVREFAGNINKDSSPLAIGRLLRGVQGSLSEQNFNDIQTALVKKGVDLKEAETIAKWMNHFIEGGKLTKKQLTALENNNDLAEVLYDTIIQPNSAVMQRNQMYKQLYDIAINKERKTNGETITNSQLNTETNTAHKAEVSDGELLSKETERSASNEPASAKIANVDDKVSNTGATFVKSTGEEVSIKKIASIDTKNKTMKIELNDGNVVDSKDISYGDKNQALLYENVLRLGYDTNTANAIISGYTPSTILSVEDYLIGTRQAFNYGWGHIPEKARTGIGYKALTPEQRAYAYKLGEDARAADDEARGIKASQNQPHISNKKAKDGYGVKLNVDQNTVTDRVKESVKALDAVSKALKINITIADLGGNAYGYYKASTNELFIDVNAGDNGEHTLLFTASHELVHYIRKWSPAKFTVLADFLMEQYVAKGENIDALIQAEIDKAAYHKVEMTYEEAYEEVVAQAMQRFLTDSNFIEHLSALQKKDANLAERLVAKLKEILDNIRAAYQGIDTKDRASQAVKEMGEAANELYAKMEEALLAIGEASQSIGARNLEDYSEAKNTNGEELFQYKDMEANQDYATRTVVEKLLSDKMNDRLDADTIAAIMQKPVDNIATTNILSSATQIKEFDSSKEKIASNIQDIAKMSSVYDVDKIKLEKTGKRPSDIFEEHFKKWGNRLRSDELGDITVEKSSVKSEIRHGLTAEKIASIEAIPAVIKDGKVIFVGQKSESGLQRIVVCAPIKIGNTPYYMGVMLQRDVKTQRLYLHNVAIEKEASEVSQDDLLTTGSHEDNEHLFVTSILQNALAVKYKNNEAVKTTTDLKAQYANTTNYDFSKSFSEQIDDYKAGNFPRNDTLIVCSTPKVFKGIGLNPLPMAYTQGHLKDALANKDGDHLGEVLIKKLPQALQNPIAIIDSTSKSGRLVAIIEIPGQTRNTIAAVEIEGIGLMQGNLIDINLIVTAHSRNNAISKLLKDAVDSELATSEGVYYWQKNKAIQLLNTNGVQFPGLSNIADGFVHSITDVGSKVKTKFSDVTETQQFKRWFGNWKNNPKKASKVVNKDGTPRIVYHYTNEDFTVFDTSKSGTNQGQTHGDGIYLSTSADEFSYAGKNKMELYANIRKPFEMELTDKQATYVLEKYATKKHDLDKFNGSYRNHALSKLTSPTRVFDYLTEYAADNGVKVSDILKDLGYDGVHDGSEWVAFDRNQVKSATDNIGTYDSSNPDIRYQYADERLSERYTYEELTSKPDMKLTVISDNVPKNRADVVSEAKKNASKIGKFNSKDGSVSVHVADVGEDVVVSTGGLRHSLDRRFAVNAPIAVKAGEILQNSIKVNEMTPENANADSSYVLIGAARNEKGELYIVRSVVNRFKSELVSMDVLYAINAKTEPNLGIKKENQAGAYPQGSLSNDSFLTDSTISISQLIDYVNKYFPDVLPESVLRHYGYDARPDGELGEDVLYQYKDINAIDNRTLLAKALESAATTDLEKQKLKEYQSKIDIINAEEKKLSELRAQIKELSFSKGKRNTTKLTELQIEAKKSANRINIYDKQLLRLEAAKPLANVLQREKDIIRKKMDQQRKEAVKAAKEKEMAKMQEMSARYQESRKKAVERRNMAQIRNKIRSFKENLEGTLLNPTDKRYVPFGLAQAVVDVCSLIDTDTDLYKSDGTINKTQAQRNLTKERLQALKDEYEKLKGYEDPVYSGEFDDAVYDMLNDLKENYEGRNLKEMNLDELRDMYDILRAIGDTLADARNLIGKGEGYDVYEAGYAIINEQREVARKRKKDKRSGTQKAKDGIINLSLAPVRNVERMSGYKEDSVLVDLFNDFEIGVRQKDFFEMEAKKSFEAVTTGENAKVYESAVYDAFGNKAYMDDNGKKFGISKMQMMQAILSQDRERANGMNHIKGGGLVFADLDLLRKGKLKEAISTENSHLVSNAESVVEQFRQELANDKWAQEYMAAARAFFDGKAKDAINNTMLALKHRIVAKDKNYIPFEVDQSFVVREISAANDIQHTINSYGMLQKTKDRAPQPLIMTGLNNIIDRHIDQVSVVVGLAIPVRNFNKVWNVHSAEGVNTTVNGIVETNWGVEGKKHIEQAVQDIQGPRHNNQSELYKKIKSGYIGATFLLNGSVVTKQIGSMFAATSMLRWRDPASMMGNLLYTMVNYKKIAAEVDKYTASAWKRRQGMSDAEVYSLITEGKKHPITKALNKLPAPLNPAKWITAMDSAVALSLWKYAKQDVLRANPELTGEELNRATASFYDSLIENTQSMTDVLHRPEIQKRSDIMSETFGMFKTDLYQMSGQLQSAAGRFSENKSKENAKHLGRTVYSIAASAIWGQLMTTAFALLRYKVNPYRDDEDDELTVESWLKRQSFAFGGDLMGYFLPLFGSEVVGTIENIVYGESEDIADSLALTAINDLYSTAVNIASSLKDGEAPSINDYKKLLTKSLQVFGVPANNILRTIEAIHLHSKDIANGEFFSFEAGRDKSNGQKLYEAILSGNQTQIEKIKSCYADEKAVQTAIKGEIKKRYVSGEIDYKTATEHLIDHCGMDAENVYWEMQTWEYAAENGTTEGYSKYDDFLTAVETGKKLKTVIKEYTENGVSEKTLASQITRHFKPLYVEMSRVERAKIKGYLLNAYVQLGYDRNEKSKDIDRWLED